MYRGIAWRCTFGMMQLPDVLLYAYRASSSDRLAIGFDMWLTLHGGREPGDGATFP